MTPKREGTAKLSESPSWEQNLNGMFSPERRQKNNPGSRRGYRGQNQAAAAAAQSREAYGFNSTGARNQNNRN